MILTRMIFAARMTDSNPTRLRVSGDVGTPAMTILRHGSCEPSSISCDDGVWTTELDTGDYLFEIQVEEEHWVAGRLDIVIELASGQTSPVFVYYGLLPGSPPTVGLAAWEATSQYVDPPTSSATGDSKDPWPPPPPPPPRVTLGSASAAWFTTEIAAARTRIAGQFAAAGGKCMPSAVLDAMVTEP
jgi:hypothetical protein